MPKSYDVIIIGAGPAGSATATFLARKGFDVLLLDKAPFPRDKTCGDGLTPRAVAMLGKLGVLDRLRGKAFHANEAAVFAPDSSRVVTSVPSHDGLPSTMMVVPRLLLDDTIRERALSSGASFLSPVHVTAIEPNGSGLDVLGRGQNGPFKAHGRIGVIAVGANMRLLLQLGILSKFPSVTLAARTYYENVQHLEDRMEFHFDGVPLPGYGWIFPLSEGSANIGAGLMPRGGGKNGAPSTAQQMLHGFLQLPRMRLMLDSARQVGPVRGFPIRTDFVSAPTYAPRILLVGESAGLVNPLTGEGIDYALESAEIAADHLEGCFADGDFTKQRLAKYDEELRSRFQRLFVFSQRVRRVVGRRILMNGLVRAAQRREDLRALFTDIVLGNADTQHGVSTWMILRAVLKL